MPSGSLFPFHVTDFFLISLIGRVYAGIQNPEKKVGKVNTPPNYTSLNVAKFIRLSPEMPAYFCRPLIYSFFSELENFLLIRFPNHNSSNAYLMF